MKTKFLPQLLARLALCVAMAAAAWVGLKSIELAARAENSASAPAEIAMASLAKVPVAAPWLLQLGSLFRSH